MSRILFLTYYYAPCNAVAANRPNSFTLNLIKQGDTVTVITRHWKGTEKTWEDQLKADESPAIIKKEGGLAVHYLPYVAFSYWRKPFSFLGTIIQNLKGNFDYEQKYEQYIPYIDQLMQQEKFDFILVSTPPHTTVRIGALFANKYNIPLLVDVRDFETDIVLYKERRHGWLRQQQHNLLCRYFKRWMKPAKVIVTASPPITEYIEQLTGKKVVTLNNGFNEELIKLNEVQSKEWFSITVTGTLYEIANLPVMIETCRLVVTRHPEAKIKFRFIGLLLNKKVADLFAAVLPEKNLQLTHRLPQAEAMKIASASQVLMLAGFDGLKGAYTTKIFEYLGLRRKILQIPGDRDVVEALIHNTNSGETPHTAEEAYAVIMNWYSEWKEKGQLGYNGCLSKIMEYSRENQFKKLVTEIEA